MGVYHLVCRKVASRVPSAGRGATRRNGETQELGPRHTLSADELMDPPTSDIGFPFDQPGCGQRRAILDEVLGYRPDFIEHQLAHAVRDPNGRAYNRTAFLPECRVMMQTWPDCPGRPPGRGD